MFLAATKDKQDTCYKEINNNNRREEIEKIDKDIMLVDLSTLNHFAKTTYFYDSMLYLTLAQIPFRKRKENTCNNTQNYNYPTRNVFIECIGDTFCSCGISEPRRFDGEDRSS